MSVQLGPGDDTHYGTGGNDSLNGGEGDDLLGGGPGDDTIDGGRGADTILGSEGSDVLFGGLGYDVLDLSGETRGGVRNGAGLADFEYATLLPGGGTERDHYQYFEILILTNFGDTISGAFPNMFQALYGLGGDDVLSLPSWTGGITIVDGGVGDDTISGSGNVMMLGGDGDDLIDHGHSGYFELLSGDAGNDTLIGGYGDTLLGGDGVDELRVDEGAFAASLHGGAGNDTYVFFTAAAPSRDVFREDVDGGIDTVVSHGSHALRANFENLVLTLAGSGIGNGLANHLTGSAGADTLEGRGGDDTALGGDGADTLIGGVGNDSLGGGTGDDLLRGDDAGGDNLLVNGSFEGATTPIGDGRVSAIEGWELGTPDATRVVTVFAFPIFLGPSDGIFALYTGGDDVADTVSQAVAGLAAGVTYRLTFDAIVYGDFDLPVSFGGIRLLPPSPGVSSHQRFDVDIVGGMGDGTDTLTIGQAGIYRDRVGADNFALFEFGTGADTLDGGAGRDTLDGGAGNDSLIGGDDADSLNGGLGADTMVGGTGNDRYVVDNVGDVVIEAADGGIDLVSSSRSYTLGDHVEQLLLRGLQGLSGTGNALDNLLTGNGGANLLRGEDGEDTLRGGAGADTLEGGTGNDWLDGGAEDDWLDGGVGADTMIGGAGNDSYVVDHVGDVVRELNGQGIDLVLSSISYALAGALENLTLTGLSLVGTGNGTHNRLIGWDGNDTLRGGNGDDTLAGALGDDNLVGGTGADSLNGGDGNDTLAGGVGADTLSGGFGGDRLYGGTGNDLMLYATPAEGRDVILDFTPGEDRIAIVASGFGGGLTDETDLLASGRFVTSLTRAATQADGQFIYETGAGRLWWDANGTAPGAAVLIAALVGAPELSASDILLL